MGRRDKDIHHYFFPKKLYGKGNKLMRISYEFHHAFHNFYMAHCKYPPRTCGKCQFSLVCCYADTSIPFGERVN